MLRLIVWGSALVFTLILGITISAAVWVSCAQAAPLPATGGVVAAVAAPGPAVGHFAPKEAHVLMLMTPCRDPKTRKDIPGKTCPSLSSDGRQLWALTMDLTYRTHAGDTITVPKGMTTDLASIPKFASIALPPDGPWAQAAIVHDLLYISRGNCVPPKVKHGHCSRAKPYTRDESDLILKDAMGDLGISGWRVWAIYTGVHLGGRAGWGH